MDSPDLRRRFNLGVALWALALGALALFLAAPLQNSNLSSFQMRARETIALLAPFALVGALGAAVGLAELTSTFGDYPREAVATRWGFYLIALNAIAAVLAFVVVRIYVPPGTDSLLLILVVGVGFPTLIRTKFTLAKQFGGAGGEDLNVNIGWLYEQFQNLCKKQIDLELMTYRRSQVDRLLARYPTVQELYQVAIYTLKARAMLTPEEEAARLEELRQAIDPKVPPELARMNLGLLILELGGVAYVDLLTRAKMAAATSVAGGAEVSPDGVVKKLAARPLAELEQLARDALRSPQDRERVKTLAEPAPGISELTQKASIARLLVDRVGAEAAQRIDVTISRQ